jgi:hypothetical protein
VQFATAFLVVVVSSGSVCAQITVEPTKPMLGQATVVQVGDGKGQPAPAVELKAAYFPGSEVEETVTVGSTDPAGTVTWTPEHAGLVRLTAGEKSATISVRYPSAPLSGLIVFVVAGSILLGGIALGTWKISSAQSPRSS